MTRATENDVALAVLKIAAGNANHICTFDEARAEVPNYVSLSTDDLQGSTTRNGEPLWHQLIRNIQSHHNADGNFIYEGYLEHVPDVGYRVTAKGLATL